jgi:hypothetical protein
MLSQACCSIVTRPKQLGAGLAVLECCRTLVFLFRNDNGPRLSLRQGWGVPQFKKMYSLRYKKENRLGQRHDF